MLVRNYGLYWASEKVHWSHQGGTSGSLLGVPDNRVTAKPTDFREQIAVYALYKNFQPVYVGQTGSAQNRLWLRLRQHRRDHLKDRWDSFSWFGLIPVTTKGKSLRLNFQIKPKTNEVLDHIEAILTAVIEPPLNLQRGRFGKAQQYVQMEDPNLPLTTEQKVDRTLGILTEKNS